MNPLRRLLVLVFAASLLAAAQNADGAPTCERWTAGQTPAANPNAAEWREMGGMIRLRFDLSAIPQRARVHHAWLRLHKEDGQPYDPIQIFTVNSVDEGSLGHDGKRLSLEAPWYRRFVATEAVRRWVEDPQSNQGFAVAPFDGFQPERSALEVCYDGAARDLPAQVDGLRAVHRSGQTFLVWTEHEAYRPKPNEVLWIERFSEKGDVLASGPGQGAFGMSNHPAITLRTLRRLQGLGLREQPSGFQGIKPLQRVQEVPPITYRVYRHSQPVTAANVHQAEILAEVGPLSGLDTEVYRIHFKGEYLDQWEEPGSPMFTFRIGDGTALMPGEALYVHTPPRSGRAYYAVTTVLAGTENLAHFGAGNALAEPVEEEPESPRPVLQFKQVDRYSEEPIESWYRFWAAPPYCNLPSRSFRVAYAVSDRYQGPGPLEIGTISGAFNVREEIRVPKPDRVSLKIERQLAWMPALFYNEGRGTLRAASECRVDYFSERYMELVINWVMDRYPVDRSQISGSLLYFGLRHPEIFPKMSFGTYTATYDYRWAPGNPAHLGPMGIKTVDGEDAWEMYSVGGYVLEYPERDIPFLICISGTGKDRGHTSEFGWQDDPRGWRALMDARQPFVASWSGGGDPYDFSRKLAHVAWDLSVPAFSDCSLDNNPGNGDPADGDYYGQINGYLAWASDVVDERGRWEMTVYVTDDCRRDTCTVDLTPRHCRRFKPRPGERFAWTNTSLANQKQVQSGTLTADEWGLVTIEKLRVTKGKHRIQIVK